MRKPLLFLVAGGSASGKTTVVEEVLEKAGTDDVLILRHDDYYHDQSDFDLETRAQMNYDHPKSLDNGLLLKQLHALLNGETVEKPIYDFLLHNRRPTTETVTPKSIIIVEGILILEHPDIRMLADMCIYVELDDDTRFIRRMLRDMQERGRALESIIHQYVTTVKPMFHKYIKPTKRYADVIIPNERQHDKAVDLIVTKIRQYLHA